MSTTLLDDKSFTKYLSRHEIEAAVQSLANRINADYEGKPVVLVGVLKGAIIFMADLARALTVDAEIEFVRLSSYGRARTSSGTVTILKDISADIRDKHVLIVEEIIDSGRTLKFLYERLKTAGPASVEIVTLLDKASKRIVDVPVKYVGRSIDDQFLIGYGLDLEERCRNLPDVYYLKYPN
jgi:hypoxanthine phosphoribosyltransferase